MENFSPSDYWKGIVLYGLNAATYKMALAKCLLGFAKTGADEVPWDQVAASFYQELRTAVTNWSTVAAGFSQLRAG
jgi:hypothetical protein